MATYNGQVTGGGLNLRQSASTSSGKLTQIPDGASIVVSDYSGNSSWYCTTYGSYSGFVMKQYVKILSNVTSQDATVTGGGLNLRSYPSTGASSPVQIPDTTKITVQKHNDAWCSTTYNGHSGFVMTKYLSIGGSTGGGGGGTSGGTLIKGTSFSGTHSSLVTGPINIRKEPSASSAKVGDIDDHQIAFNTYYTFTGVGTKTQQQEWLYVSTNYAYGYVLAKLIGSGGNTRSKHSITGSGVRLRSTPNTNSTSNVITTMDLGEKVDVIDSTSVSGWYRVVTMNGTGWVSSSYVKEN